MSHWKKAILDRLDKLHELYGHDQSLPDILDGLNTRLERARQLYGYEKPIAEIVNSIYSQLDELRKLYGSEHIEEILDGIIDRKRRETRLVELKSKGMLSVDEHHEIVYIERLRQRYLDCLAKRKAQSRATNSKNGIAESRATA